MDRRRALFLMFLFSFAAVCAGITLNYVVNPYGVWSPALIDPIYRRIVHNRAEMPHLLRSAKPTMVLVGSSRIYQGMPIEQGYRDGVLNAGLGGASLREVAEVVDLALANPRLERIVWDVDFFQLDAGFDQEEPILDERIGGSRRLLIEDTLLNLGTLGDSFDVLKRAVRGQRSLPATKTATVPWPSSLICQQLEGEHFGLIRQTPTQIETQLTRSFPNLYVNYQFSTDLLQLFQQTVNRARARGIEVIVLVPPMSQYELELIRQRGLWKTFEDFKRSLVTVGPFLDFSGYNEIADRDELFTDVLHTKPAVGYQVLRIALGMKPAACSPGVRLVARSAVHMNRENIESELAREDAMREVATAQNSRYSQVVAEAIEPSLIDR
ncbi:MAG TPA: hypothetical protein VMD75_00060 [Candidatus Binataceae bacterium]|nr:hypothetical protein [Candidatus Binataceae bacterium]